MGLIWTSDDSEFEPRRGYPWDALRATLSDALGSDYECLLAEPVARRGEGRTDWYTDAIGTAAPASALTPDQRAALFATLEGLQRRVLALADSLEAPNRRSPDKGLAQELRRAMVVPDPARHVWSVGGRPVLVAWGFTFFGQKEIHEPLIGEGIAREVEPVTAVEAPPPKAQRRFPLRPFLWGLFTVLVAASYSLLLRACGVILVPEESWLRNLLPAACQATAASTPLGPLIDRREELEGLIRQAEIDLARAEGECQPPATLPSPPPPPAPAAPPAPPPKPRCPPPPTDLQRRLDREQAAHGHMEISVKWNSVDDMDLHVRCPDGTDIYFGNRNACGGALDVDMNVGGGNRTSPPVEHIVWDGEPPHGRYEINLVYFKRYAQPARPVPFEVFVTRDGQTEGPFRGVATQPGVSIKVHRLTVSTAPPPPPPTPSRPANCRP